MKLRNVITEEICEAEAREDGIYIKANWSDEEKWFRYDLETLARGWDYYVEPAEPLIKDEKIRKAVRAWAEANSLKWAAYSADGKFYEKTTDYEIVFKTYTNRTDIPECKLLPITELCGEEEE